MVVGLLLHSSRLAWTGTDQTNHRSSGAARREAWCYRDRSVSRRSKLPQLSLYGIRTDVRIGRILRGRPSWNTSACFAPRIVQVAWSASVKVFGRRPSRTFAHAPRPASENLQGTKPRERARIGRCRALRYGDLAVGGPQVRSAARWGEWWRWRCSSGATRFSDLRASVSRKIGVAVAR